MRPRYPDDAVRGAGDDDVEWVPLAGLAEGAAEHLRGAAAARVHGAQRAPVDVPRAQIAAAARRYVALKHHILLQVASRELARMNGINE